MGQKVPPRANRIGYTEDWNSKWYNPKLSSSFLIEDYQIRDHIYRRYGKGAAISRIIITRAGNYTVVNIFTARPGIIIGRKGQEIESLQSELMELINTDITKEIKIQISEIIDPALDAQIMADTLALQIERNIDYKRAMKRLIQRIMEAGAEGVKVKVSGRLRGQEIARKEWLAQGKMPVGTFKANIDYGQSEALIKKGKLGIKVWIFKGYKGEKKEEAKDVDAKESEVQETTKG